MMTKRFLPGLTALCLTLLCACSNPAPRVEVVRQAPPGALLAQTPEPVPPAQGATNGEREATMVKSSQEALATTLSEQTRREAIVDAQEQYSFETGQGVNTCSAVNLTATVTQSLSTIGETGRKLYTDVDVSPGKATTVASATATRLATTSLTDAGARGRAAGL